MKKAYFLALCIAAQAACFGGEVKVFQSDFANNRDLKGWEDVWCQAGTKKVRPDLYSVVEENGEVFYRVNKFQGKHIMFGLSHKLDKPITVDDNLLQIRVEVTLRKHKGNTALQAGFALSSLVRLEGNQGQAFWRGKDSGFLVMGNDYKEHVTGNKLSWQKDGAVSILHPPKKPCNFMTDLEKWLRWKVVYLHPEKELRFYRDAADETPFLVQRNVDLSGVVLQSVWLAAFGNEYKDVQVFVTTK